MKQTSSLTRSLIKAQEQHAATQKLKPTTGYYRLYVGSDYDALLTQDYAFDLVSRYFDGATFTPALGLWKGNKEYFLVIDIITDDRQNVFNLAGDLRVRFGQQAVLIVWSAVSSFLLTEDSIRG